MSEASRQGLGPSRVWLLVSTVMAAAVGALAGPHAAHFGPGFLPLLGIVVFFALFVPVWAGINVVRLVLQSRRGQLTRLTLVIRAMFDAVILLSWAVWELIF